MRPRPGQSGMEAPLVHSWSGPDDIPEIAPAETPVLAIAGSTMPEEEIRRRSRGWRARPLETPGWSLLATPNSLIRGDVPLDGVRTAGVYAEEMNVVLRSVVGGGHAGPFSVRVFREDRDFRLYATLSGAPNAASFYDPKSGEMVLWFDRGAPPELFQRAFSHEFTHAFMDRVWGRTGPLWFAEGMAEYFSNLEWRPWMLVPGWINPAVVDELGRGPWGPLRDLFAMGREDMYGPLFPRLYAQAWSVVHFLFSRRPEAIVALLQAGAAGAPNPEDMEPEWRAYVEELLGFRASMVS